MDGRKSAGEVEVNGQGSAKRGGAEPDGGFVADSWFRDRLNFVRNELRKELRSKLVSAPAADRRGKLLK